MEKLKKLYFKLVHKDLYYFKQKKSQNIEERII